jgi:hypothetical protein
LILCRDFVDRAESARDRFLIFSSVESASFECIDGVITAADVIFVSLSKEDDV